MVVKEIFNMKDVIKDTRDTLEEVLPGALVVEVDDPEGYVEYKGLDVAQSINGLIHEELSSIGCIEGVLKDNLDVLADKDIKKLKDIVAQKKANINILEEITTVYDEIEVDKSATQSLKKLLKRSK